MYQLVKNGKHVAWKGSLHDCLYNLAHVFASHNQAHTVTAAQAVQAGYSIVKAGE